MKREDRIKLLKELLLTKILVLDGATGTALQQIKLNPDDFGGSKYEGCNEYLNIVSPHIIENIHKKYLDAGADIIETNSFGTAAVVLDDYDLGERSYEISKKSGEIARNVVTDYIHNNPDRPRFVAGSIGPTTKSLSLTGGISLDNLIENFYTQAKGLYDGDVDYFLLETCNDTRNIKAALEGIRKLYQEVSIELPIAISITIEANGTMLGGQGVEALYSSIENIKLLYVGLNCATGPDFMTDHIRNLNKLANCPIACVPNAGLPDENGLYLEGPSILATALETFIEKGWINLIGGCCGTTYDHINALSELVKNKKPRTIPRVNICHLSGIDYLEITDDKRPILVGERTNVYGSKKFKRLITEQKFDEACEIAKLQVKNGADIIDVCLANPDSDELNDMKLFLSHLTKSIKAPLMIDTTYPEVVEAGLKFCQGKSIINSINLEDGDKKFKKIVMMAKKHGASLVIGTIDENPEDSMAITRERKVEIADRSRTILNEMGIKDEDMFFDPLVFPCATGDQKYVGSAVETIEGIKLIKKSFPRCKTVVGLSNVSFGLPPAGREVLNSVFMYHCVKAGLDLAIVNSQKIKRFATLSEYEIELCENLIWNKGPDPISEFVKFFRDKKDTFIKKESNLTTEEEIANQLIEGLKTDLTERLDKLLKKMTPLEIINGPLMDGMGEVGKLFNSNKLIVAEVLQSAEVMKAAVNYLKPKMKSGENSSKGKFLIATVRGDVHDIGKNLVEIILSNNGYEVINLGIKVPSDQLIQACKKHNPDIIGLSGLLVKSTQEMINSCEDLANSNIDIPVICGGAALSKRFVSSKIGPVYKDGIVLYARDAMSGLDLSNKLMDPKKRLILKEEMKKNMLSASNSSSSDINRPESLIPSTKIKSLDKLPIPSDFDRHVLKNTSIDTLWKFINPKMLMTKHLGVSGKFSNHLFENDFAEISYLPGGEKAIEIYNEVCNVKDTYSESILTTGAVYQFFKCVSQNNCITLYDESSQNEIITLKFPRQKTDNGLCLSDYVYPKNKKMKKIDSMALFLVTIGSNIKDEVEKLKNSGNFLRSHILSALSLELAEAYAEYVHKKIRASWGHPDHIDLKASDLLKAKYHGRRYSYGYAACPDLENQTIIFDLLKPDEINLKLTDGFMMDPEASVSALAFHHPDATYFNVNS